jgi:ribonuclease-3
LRANLVNQNTLAEIAHELKLGDYLYLGEGELKSGGFNRPSILADALEPPLRRSALMRTSSMPNRWYAVCSSRIAAIDPTKHAKDAKTRLQEACRHANGRCPNTASSPRPARPTNNGSRCCAIWAN